MNMVEHARTMAAYNHWMNGKLYEASGPLPDAERKRDLGAFFKSIHGTLNHLLLADRLWLGRFTQAPFLMESLDQELYADFEELRRERERTDQQIIGWAGALSEKQFGSQLTYVSVIERRPRSLPFWLAVLHFFNHQTHHRGQVTTLLMQSGIDPGETDLLWLPQLRREM